MATAFNVNFLANPKVRKLVKNSRKKMSQSNNMDVFYFRKIIEIAWSNFRWNGRFARLS